MLGLVLSVCLSFGLPRAQGPTPRIITIADFKFAPAELTVSVGDTIVWSNGDAFRHTTTADSGAWASPELGKGERFVLASLSPGRFPYHCAAHPLMRGTVVVRQ